MTRTITDAREKILDAAERLFEVNGFHATGVDMIASRSNVTKRTLYKQFGSKNGLIEQVLRRHQIQMMDSVRSHISKTKAEGAERLLACFDLYQKWFSKPCFAGCIFIKTLNEFQQCSEQLSAIAAQAKLEFCNYLAKIAEETGANDPALLAGQLQIILEGSVVVAQCGRKGESIRTARKLAETIVSQALS